MNPGYAGRSDLPENLKQLFRQQAMTVPNSQDIAQVTLYAQGFLHSDILAKKIAPFFESCYEQLSRQPHYDFGLRALKSVLRSSGHIKRSQNFEAVSTSNLEFECQVLIRSLQENIMPKLVQEDVASAQKSVHHL